MKLREAINILEKHNKWRRGYIDDMVDVYELGIAIDVIVSYYKHYQKDLKNLQVKK